jgi:hypothetical protein
MQFDLKFLYRGDASGVSAIVTHTADTTFEVPRYINVRGASSLPQLGGLSQQSFGPEAIPNELQPLLRFESVRTSAFGREEEKAFVADVVAELRGLQVGSRQHGVIFSANLLRAQLQSVHFKDALYQQPQISWQGTTFEGLSLILGREEFPIEVIPDKALEPLVTEELMDAAYAKDPERFQDKFFRADDPTQAEVRDKVPRFGKNSYILTSLVESVKTSYPDAQSDRHILTVGNFGTIRFGEVTIAHDTRTLTLVRFMLGSPLGAQIPACSVRSDGEPITS